MADRLASVLTDTDSSDLSTVKNAIWNLQERKFEQLLAEQGGPSSPELTETLWHQLRGGKRLRAVLPSAVVGVLYRGAPDTTVDQALDVAQWGGLALELLHAGMLAHDDIADQDDERRGAPALWKQYGIPQAIVTGDLFFFLAMQAVLHCPLATSEQQWITRYILRKMQNVAAGQTMELVWQEQMQFPRLDQYYEMAEGKTGSLFDLAVVVGGLAAGRKADHLKSLADLGSRFGEIFQVQDDLLDVLGLERTVSSDLLTHKPTWIMSYYMEHGPDDEKQRLRELFRGRQETNETIAELRSLLTSSGVLDQGFCSLAGSIGDLRAQAARDEPDLAPLFDSYLSEALQPLLGAHAPLDLLSFKAFWTTNPQDISLSWYDTAVVARLVKDGDPLLPLYPHLLDGLLTHCSDEGHVGVESDNWHHNIVATVAFANTMCVYNDNGRLSDRIQRAVRYIVTNIEKITDEEHKTASSELVLVVEIDLLFAQDLAQRGVTEPEKRMIDDVIAPYRRRRTLKTEHFLTARSSQALYMAYGFEGMPLTAASVELVRAPFTEFGNVSASPSATARYYELTKEPEALCYLEQAIGSTGNTGAPSIASWYGFELTWCLYYLMKAGFDVQQVFASELQKLRELFNQGISSAEGLPPESDTTALSLSIFNRLGIDVASSAALLEQWWNESQEAYCTWVGERRGGMTCINIHVLEGYLSDPSIDPARKATIWTRVTSYLEKEARSDTQDGIYWTTKWHLSPLYPTSDVVETFSRYQGLGPRCATDLHRRAVRWLLGCQQPDGGFLTQQRYGATAEESAYAILALKSYYKSERASGAVLRVQQVADAIESGERYLRRAGWQEGQHPPLWICKTLYSPVSVIRSAIFSALQMPWRTVNANETP